MSDEVGTSYDVHMGTSYKVRLRSDNQDQAVAIPAFSPEEAAEKYVSLQDTGRTFAVLGTNLLVCVDEVVFTVGCSLSYRAKRKLFMLNDITTEERKAYTDWIGSRVPRDEKYSDRDLFIIGMRAVSKQQESKQPVGFLYEREGFQEAFSKRRIGNYLSAGAIETPLYRSAKPLPITDFKGLTERLAGALSEQLLQMTPEECSKVLAGLRRGPEEKSENE